MSTAVGAGTPGMGRSARASWRPTCSALPMSAHIKPEKGTTMARRPIYDKIGASPDIYVHKWDYDADTGLRHERPKSRWYRYQAVSRDGHTYLRQIAPEEQALARSRLLLAQA